MKILLAELIVAHKGDRVSMRFVSRGKITKAEMNHLLTMERKSRGQKPMLINLTMPKKWPR